MPTEWCEDFGGRPVRGARKGRFWMRIGGLEGSAGACGWVPGQRARGSLLSD